MKVAGFVDFVTDLDNSDFAKKAEAAWLLGLTAERPEQVRPMIAQAFAHDGPALVEVPVHRPELAMPPTRVADASDLPRRRTVGLGACPLRQGYPGFHGIRRRRSEVTQDLSK